MILKNKEYQPFGKVLDQLRMELDILYNYNDVSLPKERKKVAIGMSASVNGSQHIVCRFRDNKKIPAGYAEKIKHKIKHVAIAFN